LQFIRHKQHWMSCFQNLLAKFYFNRTKSASDNYFFRSNINKYKQGRIGSPNLGGIFFRRSRAIGGLEPLFTNPGEKKVMMVWGADCLRGPQTRRALWEKTHLLILSSVSKSQMVTIGYIFDRFCNIKSLKKDN
jgi:hypothetical protein